MGPVLFMSVLCLRVNFEKVWSVCHLPPLLSLLPVLLHHHLLPPPPPPPLPLSCLPCRCRMWRVFRLPPSLMPSCCSTVIEKSHVTTGVPPPQQQQQHQQQTPCCQPPWLACCGAALYGPCIEAVCCEPVRFVINKVIFHI